MSGLRSRVCVVAVLASALALHGCASSGTAASSDSALIGGFAASDVRTGNNASSIVAAMGGGLIGSQLGAGVGSGDRRRALEAEYQALEYGQTGQEIAWNGDVGVSGQVVAYQPYRVGSQDCRQYQHTVLVGGQTRSVRGSACRNADGSWTPLV